MEMLGIPKIDVRSVGAGGGSIAWIDAGGLLHVGPKSASARPGPACYGLGGTEPTVTDANVVLGIIDPDYYLGGKIKLDRAKAEAAIGKIAKQLKLSLKEAAYAIYTTSNHNMIAGDRGHHDQRGHRPPRLLRGSAAGGATACHIGEMVRLMGIKRFMVPKFAAGLSAFGGLISDVRWEEAGTHHTTGRDFDLAKVNTLLAALLKRGKAFLKRAGFTPGEAAFRVRLQGRYLYQSWTLKCRSRRKVESCRRVTSLSWLPPSTRCTNASTPSKTRPTPSSSRPGRSGRSATPAARNAPARSSPYSPASRKRSRSAKSSSARPAIDASRSIPGRRLWLERSSAVPAVIEQPTTTILLLDGQVATTNTAGDFLVEASDVQ